MMRRLGFGWWALVAATMLLPQIGLVRAAAAQTAAARTVTVWHPFRGQEKAALSQVTEAYNARGSIRINLLQIPYDAFADKITAAIARGKGPDLFIFAQDRLGDWAAGELIEPIDFWLTAEMRGTYLPQTVEAMTYDGAVYGLPIAFKTVALYYNTALVTEPPKTTDELIAVARRHTDRSQKRYGLVYENASFYYQAMWMQGFGGRVFSSKGRPTLDTPQVIESMRFAQDLSRNRGVMPGEIGATLVTTLFNSGKAAMVVNGPWFMGEIDEGVAYGVAPLPIITGAGRPAAPFMTAEGVIMSANAVDKKAAFEVMKHLTSPEAGTIMVTVGRQPSARREVYDDPAVKADPVLGMFRRQLEHSVPMPNSPAMRMVWSPATIAMNKIINGGEDPVGVMKRAQSEIESLTRGVRR